MSVYYIMIIIEISKKRILIGRIFHFCRCWNHLIVLGLAVSLADALSPIIIPTCNSNDVARSAVGLSQAASR